jgi:FkbM family methyltransferase
VHAVEPVSTLYERLSQVRDPRLSVYQVCLSDHNGDGYIFCSVGHNQGHTLNAQFLDLFPDAFGISPPRQPVHLFRADDLFPETRFDFMKIDVEGSEAALLDGAKRLLSKSAPRAIQIEIYPSQFEQVDARLRPYFSSARRAAVIGEALVLSDIDSPPPKGPPIFVYSNEAGL